MNLSLRNIKGATLIVAQFTLVAETKRGLRPSFSKGMSASKGRALFTALAKKHKHAMITSVLGLICRLIYVMMAQ